MAHRRAIATFAFFASGMAADAGASKEDFAFLQSFDSYANTSPWLRGLFVEINKVLPGAGSAASDRFPGLEKALATTFAAMPKNEHGRLDRPAVRYALHRFLEHRHGWFIQGLAPEGSLSALAPNKTLEPETPGAASTGWLPPAVPESIVDIFEERLQKRGFSLFELAALATTLESLVHGEAAGKLRFAYRANEHAIKDVLRVQQADNVLDTYMAAYMVGKDLEFANISEASRVRQELVDTYPNWDNTQRFLRDTRRATAGNATELTFKVMVQIIDSVSAQYGRSVMARECQSLKSELIKAGDGGSGCVPLAAFYRGSVHGGSYQFSESPEYLRQLGALDETDPAMPQVIVPNYISSPANCLGSSKYYSVCCIDECEEILGRFERSLRSPEATPSELQALAVSVINEGAGVTSSPLPVTLVRRLNEIAQKHQGRVPLHSRLFAQWMHHAFPRECAYPHLTGTVNPLSPEAYFAEAGVESSISDADLRRFSATEAPDATGAPDRSTDVRRGECTAWLDEEELFVRGPGGATDDELWAAATGMALLTAAASAALVGARAWLLAGKAVTRRTATKELVAV